MSDVVDAHAAYTEAFSALETSGKLDGKLELRKAALAGLQFPLRRNEAWRFTPARKLVQQTYPCTYGAFQGSDASVQFGVDAIRDTPLEVHLGKVSENEGFSALNLAFFADLATVHTPAGEQRTVEIRAKHAGLSTPRVLIVGDAGSHTEVLLHHDVQGCLAVPVVEIVAMDGATIGLTHVVEGTQGHFAGQVAVGTGKDASVALRSMVSGADIVRLDVKVGLGEGARFDSSGLVLASGSQHADHHLDIRHAGANAVSSQLFRNILDEKARAVFTGEVHVDRDITGSDATQTANTLLLSDDASAVARPWLVIDNDEVTASHGATVGRLDPDALFYLRARGIGALEARRLLTRAFAGEVVETVPEAHRQAFSDVVERWLGRRTA